MTAIESKEENFMKINETLVKKVQEGTPMECDPFNTSIEQLAKVTEAILPMRFDQFPLARFYRIENGEWYGYMHNSTNLTPIPLKDFFVEEKFEPVEPLPLTEEMIEILNTPPSEPVDKVEGERFFKMQHFPDMVKGETFSKTVLIFSEDDNEFCDLGYYDFTDNEWNILGDLSFKMICWCYVPSPTEFLKTKNFKSETHYGYR